MTKRAPNGSHTDKSCPVSESFQDIWTVLKPKQTGETYDRSTNPMLIGDLKHRADRVFSKMKNFQFTDIQMIGQNKIPNVLYRDRQTQKELPVLPSDHFGLLVELKILRD